MRTRVLKLSAVAGLGAGGFFIVLALVIDWQGSRFAAVPWLASLAHRQGQCFYAHGSDRGNPDLVPITQVQFDRRLAYASVAGWLAAGGLWVVLVSGVFLMAKHVMKGEGKCSQRETAYKGVLLVMIMLTAGLGAADFAVGILEAKLTGTPFNGGPELGPEGARFNGRAGFNMPISSEQYHVRMQLEGVAFRLWVATMFAIALLLLTFFVGLVFRSDSP